MIDFKVIKFGGEFILLDYPKYIEESKKLSDCTSLDDCEYEDIDDVIKSSTSTSSIDIEYLINFIGTYKDISCVDWSEVKEDVKKVFNI